MFGHIDKGDSFHFYKANLDWAHQNGESSHRVALSAALACDCALALDGFIYSFEQKVAAAMRAQTSLWLRYNTAGVKGGGVREVIPKMHCACHLASQSSTTWIAFATHLRS